MINKKNFKKLKLLGLPLLGIGFSSIVAPIISFQNNETSVVQKNTSSFNNVKASSETNSTNEISNFSNGTGVGAWFAGEHFNIKTYDNITDPNERKNLQSIYANKQSDVNITIPTNDANSGINIDSLYNLFVFTEKVYGYESHVNDKLKPKIEILSKASSDPNDKENANTPLNKHFESTPELTITQNFLDSIGLLYLKVTTYDKNSNDTNPIQYDDYVVLTGFGSSFQENSTPGRITPNEEVYKKRVKEVSDTDLSNSIKFNSSWVDKNNNLQSETNPDIAKVTKRVNDDKGGKISYDVNYQWHVQNEVINAIKEPSVQLNVSSGSIGIRNLTESFYIEGLQPSPSLSVLQIGIIVAIVILGAVIISTLIFLVSIVTRKIRNSRKM